MLQERVSQQKDKTDRVQYTIARPVSNCAGCGDTKVSWSIKEGLRRFNKKYKDKKERYELIYVADRGCGNLQGYHEYRIVDAIFFMGSAMIIGEGIKDSCGDRQIVVTASGDGSYNFNINAFKIAAKSKQYGTISVIYNNYSIRMTGGQIPLDTDFDTEGKAMGYDVIHVNPYRVNDNADMFKNLMERYLHREKIMVVADGVCAVDLLRETRSVGLKLGHFTRTEECLDKKFKKERERIAHEEPEKLKELPPFKCRLCGISLRCHALLKNDPDLCFGCGACSQFPCPVGALEFSGLSFAMSTKITELLGY